MDSFFCSGLFLLSVLISCGSQVLLKKSSLLGNQGLAFYLNRYSVVAYVIFLMATFLTLSAYRGLELARGLLLETSGYIFMAALSWYFFKERISGRYLSGCLLIIIGTVLYIV